MIYKYYSVNKYSLDSLKKQEFWFSKPTEFNDPFDCNMEVLDEFLVFKKTMSQRAPDLVETFQDSVKNFGICCFSEDSNNMHLWALYANSFKGFALCFDESGFNDYFSNLFSAKCQLEPAYYRKELLNLDYGSIVEKQFEEDGLENGSIQQPINSYLTDSKSFDVLLEYLLRQKREDVWGIEKEKRLIIGGLARKNGAKLFEQEKGYSVPWKPDTLKRIILGHRMPSLERNEILSIINNIDANIEVFETFLDYKTWNIDVKCKDKII